MVRLQSLYRRQLPATFLAIKTVPAFRSLGGLQVRRPVSVRPPPWGRATAAYHLPRRALVVALVRARVVARVMMITGACRSTQTMLAGPIPPMSSPCAPLVRPFPSAGFSNMAHTATLDGASSKSRFLSSARGFRQRAGTSDRRKACKGIRDATTIERGQLKLCHSTQRTSNYSATHPRSMVHHYTYYCELTPVRKLVLLGGHGGALTSNASQRHWLSTLSCGVAIVQVARGVRTSPSTRGGWC